MLNQHLKIHKKKHKKIALQVDYIQQSKYKHKSTKTWFMENENKTRHSKKNLNAKQAPQNTRKKNKNQQQSINADNSLGYDLRKKKENASRCRSQFKDRPSSSIQLVPFGNANATSLVFVQVTPWCWWWLEELLAALALGRKYFAVRLPQFS